MCCRQEVHLQHDCTNAPYAWDTVGGDPVSGTLDPTPAEGQSAVVKWHNLIWLRTTVRQSKVCYRTSLSEQISFKYNRCYNFFNKVFGALGNKHLASDVCFSLYVWLRVTGIFVVFFYV